MPINLGHAKKETLSLFLHNYIYVLVQFCCSAFLHHSLRELGLPTLPWREGPPLGPPASAVNGPCFRAGAAVFGGLRPPKGPRKGIEAQLISIARLRALGGLGGAGRTAGRLLRASLLRFKCQAAAFSSCCSMRFKASASAFWFCSRSSSQIRRHFSSFSHLTAPEVREKRWGRRCRVRAIAPTPREASMTLRLGPRAKVLERSRKVIVDRFWGPNHI